LKKKKKHQSSKVIILNKKEKADEKFKKMMDKVRRLDRVIERKEIQQ